MQIRSTPLSGKAASRNRASTPQPRRSAGSWRSLALHADTVADIARTLSAERATTPALKLLAWAEACSAPSQSHRRDFDSADALGESPRCRRGALAAATEASETSPEQALGALFDSIPTLADLPDRCAEAIAILA